MKVGDTCFKSNGQGYDKGQVVRINGTQALVRFPTHTATVAMRLLKTHAQIRSTRLNMVRR